MPRATNFTMGVYRSRGKHYIKTIWLNGNAVLDADDCGTDKPQSKDGNIQLWSDSKANTNGARSDVTLRWEVMCRPLNENPAKQLKINIRLRDEFQNHEEQVETSMPPQTTFYFAGDTGICTDPVKYGTNIPWDQITDSDYELDCRRLSPFKFASGRYCNCTGSCAAWGDPHIIDFYEHQQRASNRNNFKSPITSEPQYNLLYHTGQIFGARKALDGRCNMMVEAQIYALKSDTQSRLHGCNRNGGDIARGDISRVERFNQNDWDVLTLRADELCPPLVDLARPRNWWDLSQDARSFKFPNPNTTTGNAEWDKFNRDHYNHAKEGMDLGMHVLVQHPDGPGGQYLVPVQGNNYANCLSSKGFDPDMASNVVDAGSVTAELTCHRTKGGLWYFNYCIQKKGITIRKFYYNAQHLQRISQEPKSSPRWQNNNGVFKALEKSAFSGGWCATGDFRQGSSVSTAVSSADFRFRNPGQVREFVRVGTDITA